MKSGQTSHKTGDSQAKPAVVVFFAVAFFLALGLALLMSAMGASVDKGLGPVLVVLMMWTPFVGRIAASKTVDRNWMAPFPLNKWGRPRFQVILLPLVLVLAIYALAYVIGLLTGIAEWKPGGGKWDTVSRVFLNLGLNIPLLLPFFTLGALGEELGWRGYLQPRLDAARVKHSLAIVIALEVIWHVPVMLLGGYLLKDSLLVTLALFTALKSCSSPMWAWVVYRMGSVWPAVFFHALHNLTSQWLYPRLFVTDEGGIMLGEFGVLPVVSYGVAAAIWVAKLHRQRLSWLQLAESSLGTAPR
jgi:membrane protease YdiL (CAAX protease family)